ncbi:MAG: hypothetical protein ACU83N_13375 [Gammaproteobacteria bacterium]
MKIVPSTVLLFNNLFKNQLANVKRQFLAALERHLLDGTQGYPANLRNRIDLNGVIAKIPFFEMSGHYWNDPNA